MMVGFDGRIQVPGTKDTRLFIYNGKPKFDEANVGNKSRNQYRVDGKWTMSLLPLEIPKVTTTLSIFLQS